MNRQIELKNTLYFLCTILMVVSLTGFKHLQTASDPAVEMLNLVNEARANTQVCGTEALPPVGPLMLNEQLNQAALVHSTDMATNNFLDHGGSDSSTFDQRIVAQGYSFSFAGENVAAGKSTAQDTMTQWLNSEGHCRNIMSKNFTQMGVGVSQNNASRYKVYWVQVFATPFGGSAANTSVITSSPTANSNNSGSQLLDSQAGTTALRNSPGSTNTEFIAPTGIIPETTIETVVETIPSQEVSNASVGPDFVDELLTLINQARAQTQTCGAQTFPTVPAFALNESLTKSAQGHSSSMAENNFFGQTGLDGQNFDKRAEAQGYRFSAIAENIIAGRPTVADVMKGLLETDGYCRGLMSMDYTELGIGFGENPNSQYKYYWTLTFAKPQ